MKTAYLIRYGAYGDHLHVSCVMRALEEEGYHITLEHNLKGLQIHLNNPRVDIRILNDPALAEHKSIAAPYGRHLFNLAPHYDKVVSFQASLEDALIEDERGPRYFWPLKWRREKNTLICYYDQSMEWAGLTHSKHKGGVGEVWFSAEEHETVMANLRKKEDTFLIMYAWRGTMQQKATYHGIGEVFTEWFKRYPDTTVFTTGDEGCQSMELAPPFQDKRFVHLSGRVPFRQSLSICKYMDMVITPETGLGIGAGVFGTSKIMLLTAASILNIAGNDENDYSLQSDVHCSPCTRAIYNTNNCFMEGGHPICVYFPPEVVLERMEEIVKAGHPRRWDPIRGPRKTADGTEVWV